MQDLTLHGKFNLSEDGTMEVIDFLAFRAAVVRQQVRKTYESLKILNT
jgi:hypothetical protein